MNARFPKKCHLRDFNKLDAKKTDFNHYMMIKQLHDDQKLPFYFLNTVVTCNLFFI